MPRRRRALHALERGIVSGLCLREITRGRRAHRGVATRGIRRLGELVRVDGLLRGLASLREVALRVRVPTLASSCAAMAEAACRCACSSSFAKSDSAEPATSYRSRMRER
jgi:hypothetical protein